MASSALDICNLALYRIGSDAIDVLTDSNERARVCNECYTHVRDKILVLTKHGWNCAKKMSELTAEGLEPRFDYGYVYHLPEDCLKVLYLSDGSGSKLEDRWEVIGQKLYTNETDEPYLVYISQLTDVEKMSPLLVECIVLQLAVDISYRLKQSGTQRKELKGDLAIALILAEGTEATEQYNQDMGVQEWENTE